MADYRAYFLVGPTAVGKTAVAHCLAKRMGAGILSADSMLVYRGMDIGTAKPSLQERREVRYYGIDLVDPADDFNVARYLEAARILRDTIPPPAGGLIVAGGTGLYIQCLLRGLDPERSGSHPGRRAHWEAIGRAGGVTALQDALRRMDGRALERLSDPLNPRRLIRALELTEQGVVLPPLSERRSARGPELTGLRMPPAALEQRIIRRVERMYADGLLDECRRLRAVLPPGSTALQAIGYAEALACLDGGMTRSEAMERTVIRTRQLAKRQMTWFRHQLQIHWIDIADDTPVETIADRVQVCWRERGHAEGIPLAMG